VFLLPGERQIGRIRLFQLDPAASTIWFNEAHQAKRAQPVLHRRLAPFFREDLRVLHNAVEVMNRRHVMLVILVIGFRATSPPKGHVFRNQRPAEICIFTAIADIARVEPPDCLKRGRQQGEVERPEATVIAAPAYYSTRRPGAFGVLDREVFEPLKIDPLIGRACRQISDFAHHYAIVEGRGNAVILD
tara:strand:- start:833 stop:1399 length:567 start_codon:yes stop_codon:yes gene_type:complete